jgi:hypothetical protein
MDSPKADYWGTIETPVPQVFTLVARQRTWKRSFCAGKGAELHRHPPLAKLRALSLSKRQAARRVAAGSLTDPDVQISRIRFFRWKTRQRTPACAGLLRPFSLPVAVRWTHFDAQCHLCVSHQRFFLFPGASLGYFVAPFGLGSPLQSRRRNAGRDIVFAERTPLPYQWALSCTSKSFAARAASDATMLRAPNVPSATGKAPDPG